MDILGFLTTLGREFGEAFRSIPATSDATGQDFYSVLAGQLGDDVTPQRLRSLTDGEVQDLARAFNQYFECRQVKAAHVRDGIDRTVRHWT